MLEAPVPLYALSVLKELLQIQNSIGTNSVSLFTGTIFFAVALLLSLAQIFLGLFSLESKLKESKLKLLIKTGLVFGILALPAFFYFLLSSYYDVVGEVLKQNPYYNPQ